MAGSPDIWGKLSNPNLTKEGIEELLKEEEFEILIDHIASGHKDGVRFLLESPNRLNNEDLQTALDRTTDPEMKSFVENLITN